MTGGSDLRTLLEAQANAAGTERLLVPAAVEAALGVVPTVGPGGRRMLADGLAGVAESLLEVDVAAAVIAGWSRHVGVLAAAAATAAAPGVTEIVDLTSHDVVGAWRPVVEVLLGASQLARVGLELSLTLRPVGVVAAVTAGRLTRIGGGRCDVAVRLAVRGTTVLERTVPIPVASFARAIGPGVDLLVRKPPLAS